MTISSAFAGAYLAAFMRISSVMRASVTACDGGSVASRIRWGLLGGAAVLLVPLQAAGEEYAFRGLAAQGLGAWLRSPLWAILLPVPLFMFGHGYNWVGQIDVAVFAICAGALVWKSGGLEIPIVMHVANNLGVFLLAPFSASSLQQGEVSPMLLLTSTPFTIFLTVMMWAWVSDRYGLRMGEPVTTATPQLAR